MISVNSYTPNRKSSTIILKYRALMNVNRGWDILKIWHATFHIISFYWVYFRSLFQNFFRWYENLSVYLLFNHTPWFWRYFPFCSQEVIGFPISICCHYEFHFLRWDLFFCFRTYEFKAMLWYKDKWNGLHCEWIIILWARNCRRWGTNPLIYILFCYHH